MPATTLATTQIIGDHADKLTREMEGDQLGSRRAAVEIGEIPERLQR